MTKLNVNDMAIMINIIDLAAERGGVFKGNDLTVVGDLRERLASFVKEVTEQQKKEATDEPSAESK